MADFGYPQVTSVDLLSKYIKSGAFKEDWVKVFWLACFELNHV
jgi:hypothetical protein